MEISECQIILEYFLFQARGTWQIFFFCQYPNILDQQVHCKQTRVSQVNGILHFFVVFIFLPFLSVLLPKNKSSFFSNRINGTSTQVYMPGNQIRKKRQIKLLKVTLKSQVKVLWFTFCFPFITTKFRWKKVLMSLENDLKDQNLGQEEVG